MFSFEVYYVFIIVFVRVSFFAVGSGGGCGWGLLKGLSICRFFIELSFVDFAVFRLGGVC